MPGWAWLLIGLFGLGFVAFVVWFLLMARKGYQIRADIIDRGDDAIAWIVDVAPAEGLLGPTALVLVSPDPDVPDDTMHQLAERLQELRERKRKPANADEREVVRVTRKAIDNPGRERLPDGFTGGWEVYSLFMDMMTEDEENLPKNALDGHWIPVRVIWDEYPTMMVVPPPRRKKRSKRRRDD